MECDESASLYRDLAITFRYMTTSQIGIEQSDPLGGELGLWSCGREPSWPRMTATGRKGPSATPTGTLACMGKHTRAVDRRVAEADAARVFPKLYGGI